jgi:hypothetical protein
MEDAVAHRLHVGLQVQALQEVPLRTPSQMTPSSSSRWERESAAQALERHVGGRRDIVIGVECPTMRDLISLLRSETGTVEPEHLQDAPRVAREKFKVPNPFPHDPKKPEQSEISVVFSSFAACIERETNTLRSLTPSASGAVEALRECRAYFERELADDQTLIDGDFGTAYRLTVAALAAAERRNDHG